MNRSTIYSQQQARSFDILNGWKDALIGLANEWQAQAGGTTGVWTGFTASATSPASLNVNLSAGQIYQLNDVDATPWGALAADTTQVMQGGYAVAQTLLLSTSGLSAGQSYWALIQVAFEQVDVIRTNDPTGGLLPYYNSANPAQPLQGPNNSGAIQDTERESVASVSVVYGTPSSGTPVPPSASSGNLPMYLILLTYGQTQVTSIYPTSPNVYSGYPYAPCYPGLTGTSPLTSSGSHHGGIPGQAAKINAATEISGTFNLSQLPVSNPNPPSTGGIIIVGGVIPIFTQGSVNPNGNVAGQLSDLYFQQSLNLLFVCTTAGTSGSAVWTQVGVSGGSQYVNTFPLTSFQPGYTYILDTSAGVGSVTLPPASSLAGQPLSFINAASNSGNPVTFAPQTGQAIQNNAISTSAVLLRAVGDAVKLIPQTNTNLTTGWLLGV